MAIHCTKEERAIRDEKKAVVFRVIRENGGAASIDRLAAALDCSNKSAAGVAAAMIRTGDVYTVETGKRRKRVWNPIRVYCIVNEAVASEHIANQAKAAVQQRNEEPEFVLGTVWPVAFMPINAKPSVVHVAR